MKTLPRGIKDVEEDRGESFWNQDYLNRFERMSENLEVFKNLNEHLREVVIPNPEATVLELGCGYGRNMPVLRKGLNLNGKGEIHGIDFSQDALELAREKFAKTENINFHQQDICNLGFPPSHFDALFDIFAGCYIPNKGWKEGLKESFRVLKPGSRGYFLYFIHGKKFSSCFKSQVPVELIHHPIGLFWALHLKLFKGLNLWDKFIERGEVVYPEWNEFIQEIQEAGGKVEVAEKAFLDTCILLRAQKL